MLSPVAFAPSSTAGAKIPERVEREVLALIGQRWTVFILREVFLGAHRFGQIQRNLGIATNVLTGRLNALSEHGLIERRPYADGHDWSEYHLTPKAFELFPLILTICWGQQLDDEDPARATLRHTTCGAEIVPAIVCSNCRGELLVGDITIERQPVGAPAPS